MGIIPSLESQIRTKRERLFSVVLGVLALTVLPGLRDEKCTSLHKYFPECYLVCKMKYCVLSPLEVFPWTILVCTVYRNISHATFYGHVTLRKCIWWRSSGLQTEHKTFDAMQQTVAKIHECKFVGKICQKGTQFGLGNSLGKRSRYKLAKTPQELEIEYCKDWTWFIDLDSLWSCRVRK